VSFWENLTKNFTFPARGEFQNYRVQSNNCNDFTDNALAIYFGKAWHNHTFFTAIGIMDIWDMYFFKDGTARPFRPIKNTDIPEMPGFYSNRGDSILNRMP
jgi:hypothetical protein